MAANPHASRTSRSCQSFRFARVLSAAALSVALATGALGALGAMAGCTPGSNGRNAGSDGENTAMNVSDTRVLAEQLRSQLDISECMFDDFVHGEKPAEFQKYIVLHDTQMDLDALAIANWWEENGNLVSAHFIVNKDGSIVQCAPLDAIVHHAGFGDTGHNKQFGVEDESHDDKKATEPIGDWAADYGMNSYSVGIEIVHVGGEGDYPEAQLKALDDLIAYIDAYFGFESEITDHKAWRTGNPDTSTEFTDYLDCYQKHRVHAWPRA